MVARLVVQASWNCLDDNRMSLEISETESCIDKRTLRAATESMTVIHLGDGEFEVYSGTNPDPYHVDLWSGECDCADQEHNVGPGECKHARRVELECGMREIPEGLGRCDAQLMIDARRRREARTGAVAIADGGTVVGAEPLDSDDEDAPACVCELDPDGLGCFEHYEVSRR